MKKTIIFLSLVMLIICMLLSACKNNQSEETIEINELCKEYSKNYDITIENSDGTLSVSVTAPDFAKIAELMAQDNVEINTKNINDYINQYSDYDKNYTFTVTNENSEEINSSFEDLVGYELSLNAITHVEFDIDWGFE